MENGSHASNGKRDVAQIARGGRLVDATPASIYELADSAMLLSQGAHRAIEMIREADSATLDVPATAQPPTTDIERGSVGASRSSAGYTRWSVA